jgi:hypothetical protein
MKINKTVLLVAGGVAAVYLLPKIAKWLKHESAEMKREEEAQKASAAMGVDAYSNYVDEGFMGFTASDEFMMLGGSKPIEFANASGHQIPVATDEPNFANASGNAKKAILFKKK